MAFCSSSNGGSSRISVISGNSNRFTVVVIGVVVIGVVVVVVVMKVR